MRNLLLVKFLFFLSNSTYAQNEVFKNVNNISQFVKINNSVNVILLGENHKGEYRQNILCEYAKILDENEIDTVFIELRYSTYVMSLIHNNVRYMNCDCLINANKVIVPVDIELNLAEALEVVGDILSENNLVGTNFYDENINVYSQYRKSGTFNQKFILYL